MKPAEIRERAEKITEALREAGYEPPYLGDTTEVVLIKFGEIIVDIIKKVCHD